MLLIDGVRYELWTPPSEDAFEQAVKEHTQEIFGEQSIYIDRKQKLKSLSGIGSIPDGYAIVFDGSPNWHIIEMELSSHPLHEHIVSQVSKFITGIGNPSMQRTIVNAIDGEIRANEFLKLKLGQAIKSAEIYRFLSDLISRPPVLTIIIEKDTEELREALSTLNHAQIKVIEFQTFERVGAEAVHAHLFEPLHLQKEPTKKGNEGKIEEPLVSSTNQLYQQFFNELVDSYGRKHPSWNKVKALPQSFIGFGAGKGGFYFEWAFRGEKRFSVDLYIDTGDKGKNKKYFDEIKKHETSLSISPILWERLDEKKGSRIALYTRGDIQSAMKNQAEKERLMEWATSVMTVFSISMKSIVTSL